MVEKNEQLRSAQVTTIRSATLARMADVPLRQPEPALPISEYRVVDYKGVERRRIARSPVAESQRHLPIVVFLPPERLPSTQEIVETLSLELRALCAWELGLADTDYKRALKALSRQIPASEPIEQRDLAFMIATGQHADMQVLDQFFRLGRVSHTHPATFLHSLFRTLQVLRTDLEEAPSALEQEKIDILARGLKATIVAAIDMPVEDKPFECPRATVPAHADFPARRWIRGHQVFTALTQALTFAFDAMTAAATTGDEDGLARAADLAGTAMEACGCALEFTADFPKRAYEDLIRISMGTPFQPDGFSGLLSSDHRHLVSRMKMTRSTMETLLARQPQRHARIVRGLANVYDSHKFVCGRFVGSEKSSLLMARETGRSATDQLERFKISRLRSLGAEPPGPDA